MTLNRLAIVLITATLVTLSGQLAPVAAQKGPASVGALKIPELGTATTPIHGFDFSATAVVDLSPTGGGSAGKTTFNQVGITRTFDAVSIELFKRIATGRRLPRVEILLYKPGTTTVETTYGLDDVVDYPVSRRSRQRSGRLRLRRDRHHRRRQLLLLRHLSNTGC